MDWRLRAAEMRNFADETRERHVKETMLSIAHDYDLLAGQVEHLEQWPHGGTCSVAPRLSELRHVAIRTTLPVQVGSVGL